VVGVLTNPHNFAIVDVLAKRHQQYLFYFFLLSFSLDEKETKNQDNKNLPSHKARSTARFIVSPTLATIQANIYKLFVPLFVF
jgi:hypothetical protein